MKAPRWNGALPLSAGTRLASAVAGLVKDHLRLDGVHRQVADRQRIRLEAPHPLEGRVVHLDAGNDRPLVVAVGEVTLCIVGCKIFEELQRGLLVRAFFSTPPPDTLMWAPVVF